jgi:hypothetical protein
MLDVVGSSVQEVTQMEMVIIVVGETVVHTKVQISIGATQEQSTPYKVIVKLPHIV